MLDEERFNSQPKYLNLAHQFLDSNFIEATTLNNFNTLPIISTNPYFDSFMTSDPPVAVDYFSYKLTSKQYHNCWKNVSNNQFMKPYELSNVDSITRLKTVQQTDDLMMFLPTTSQARLENACWRAWYKNLKNLKELNPTEINWFKENDITVLYGPLINDNSKDEINDDESSSTTTTTTSSSTPTVDDLFDQDADLKMSEDWNSDFSNDTDSDSLLSQRRYSIESTRTSLSSPTSNTLDDVANINININTTNIKVPPIHLTTKSTNKELKSILKKRCNFYSIDNRCKSKKRISFNHELNTIKIIV